ncbi:MAG: dihydroorotate dehydrogenase-like protein [Bacteroidales bacterium]
MINLNVTYAGLSLSNPIIVASSGLTNSVEKIVALEKAGAGAVVLKSLFEEQITQQAAQMLQTEVFPEAADYLQTYVKANHVEAYLDLIKGAKKEVAIPIIASINCYNNEGWGEFAAQIENAGADAIEINIHRYETGLNYNQQEYVNLHLDILLSLKKVVKIPIIFKLGQNFSNIIAVIELLRVNGAAAVVLFNRFYQPDINIDTLQITSGNIFSTTQDLAQTLRYTAIASARIPQIDIAASTGIHTPEGAIKMLLAGAEVVEVCSAIYEHGNTIISQINTYIEEWMLTKGYKTIENFRGMLNANTLGDQSKYERAQFMKYYSSRE